MVLGSNDGVVVSRSEEAKKIGVPMGVPLFKVKDIFKEHKVALFSSNFELYRDISNRVMAVLREELDNKVYPYSIDEAFFTIGVRDIKDAEQKVKKLKQSIERKVGIPVSIGLGKTMTIAKYASEREKRKSGVCVLYGKAWQELVPTVALGDIWGVGGKTVIKLREHSLLTVADLLAAPRSYLEKNFGVHGLRLLAELAERPAHSFSGESEMQKSIMSTRAFSKTTTNLSQIEASVTYHIERAAEELRQIGGKAKSLRVMLLTSRHSDWMLKGGSAEAILLTPTSDTRILLRYALKLANDLYKKSVPYKKAGVVLGRISKSEVAQISLWSDEKETDNPKLMSVIDNLNGKWGSAVVTFGRVKGGGRLDHSSYASPRYTTDWDELLKISNYPPSINSKSV